MLRRLAVVLGLLAFATALPAFGQDASVTHAVLRPGPEPVEVRTLSVPAPGAPDILVDVYAPKGKPRGAIVFVSGTDDSRAWAGYQDLARIAAQRGYLGVIPNKRWPRSGGTAAFETSHADTLALLAALNAGSPLGVGAERACVWVFSGGGVQLAAVFSPKAPKVGCIIGFYPYLGGPNPDQPAEWMRTYTALDAFKARTAAGGPPMLLVRAGKDNARLNARIADFTAVALEANYPLRLVNLPDADHGFDLFNDNEVSRDAIRGAFAFIDEQIAPKP